MKKILNFLIVFNCFLNTNAQDITLYQQFSGNVDFTMIGNTLNPIENEGTATCSILTTSSATLTLDTNDIIENAYLYWSGSGSGDFDVSLNGQAVTATRTFSDSIGGRPTFSAFADVTTQLQTTGNGNYTLSDLDLTAIISDYCLNGTNFGGWAIMVVYSNTSLPLNQINYYDGLESVSAVSTSLTIQLSNLAVIDNTDAKVGFLAWEGDASLAVNETLSVNGNIIGNPPLNPSNNAFNGTNSYTNSSDLFNMDLDFYDIEDYVAVGDTSATIQLTSGQDFVMINVVLVKLSNQLPDATSVINSTQLLDCNTREVEVDFTIFNADNIVELPVNMPISIYADTTLVATFFTPSAILANQSLNFIETINIPLSVPENFTLTVVADDSGDGTGIVFELSELNNEATTNITLFHIPVANNVNDFALCDDLPDTTDGIVAFDTSLVESQLLLGQTGLTIYYFDEIGNPLPSPLPNPFITATQTISILMENPLNTDCTATTSIDFTVVPVPIANPVTILRQCDDDQDGFLIFDTSLIENQILQGQTDVTVTYFNEDGTQIIPTLPNNFNTNSQTITIIVTSTIATNACSDETTLEFIVDKLPYITDQPDILPLCDDLPDTTDGLTTFDTSLLESTLIGTQTGLTISYLDGNGNPLPSPFPNTFTTATQTITVLIENPLNTNCTATTTINFTVVPVPIANPVTILRQCDDDQDGFLIFDTSLIENQILQGQTDVTVTYFNEDGTQILPTLPNNFNTNSQIITIIVTSTIATNTCSDETTLEFIVDKLPYIVNQPDILPLCDDLPDTTDGLTTFDTSLLESTLIGTQTGLTISYLDESGNPLPSPFPNTFTTATQTITVLIENPLNTNCTATTIIDFTVVPVPIANSVTILRQCDDDQDGFLIFNTSLIENQILQGQTDVVVTYFNEDGTQILPTLPNNFNTNSQIITIIATSTIATNACSDETTLEFIVDKLPYIVNQPDILPLCDDTPNDLDGFSEFDTSQIETTLVGLQTDIAVLYFDDNGNALPSPLPNPFNTTTQTITAVLQNTINNTCQATTTIDFTVILLPVFDVFDTTLCLNFLPETLIVNIENAQDNYNYQWKDENGQTIGTNQNSIELTEGGTYSVTATTQDSLGCATTEIFVITETEVVINKPDNLLECDEGFDTAHFNLEETIAQITTATNLEISFFTSTEDLINNDNEIINPTTYSNTSDPQTIFVRVEDLATNCYAITNFILETENCLPIIPSGFTPNNDNEHDTFTIIGLHDVYPDFEMYIYNRYGNLIFEGNDQLEDWDGTYKNSELPVGTYFYLLKFNDEDERFTNVKGFIYLNR